jgi:hypothetical protein
VATQELGDLGPGQSQPTVFHWRWYYGVPSLGLWILVGLMLVVPKENRNWQAWLILIPVVLTVGFWQGLAMLPGMPPEVALSFGGTFGTVAAAWAVLWLLGHWLSRGHRVAAFLLALAVMTAVGAIAYLGYFGPALTSSSLPLLFFYGICVLTLLLGVTLSAWCCRKGYGPGRFMGWLLSWMFLVPLACMVILAIVAAVVESRPALLLMIVQIVIMPAILGGILYLMNLPVMLLGFWCPVYRDRFQAALRLRPDHRAGPTPRYPLVSAEPEYRPVSTEPTTRPVGAADVAGPWQFYLDGLSKTVTVDFSPDGTFAQTIVANDGGVTECPGGAWRLDGPRVHLTGYVTAEQGESQARTWWMIDTPGGLALFGGDQAEAESFFRMARGPQAAELSEKSPGQ